MNIREDVESKRAEIAKAYPGERWKIRCAAMPTDQVVAIYKSFLERNAFEKLRVARKKVQAQPKELNDYRQLDLFRDFGVRA